jgi:protein-S-isoprenylcysteine O-methyltransferase Ste14
MSPIELLLRAVEWVWIAFLIYWMAMSLGNKQVVRKQSLAGRALQMAVGGFAFMLLWGAVFQTGPLAKRIIPLNVTWIAVGLALICAGIAFAVWARVTLGRNWSGIVTVKQDHQLIRTGPYAIVRHPIYSGLLLAIIGTAVSLGKIRGFLAVVVILVGWWLKWRAEENFMVQEFGEQYEQYRRQTPALIPFSR